MTEVEELRAENARLHATIVKMQVNIDQLRAWLAVEAVNQLAEARARHVEAARCDDNEDWEAA